MSCDCNKELSPCGCCEGTDVLTPLPVANRPGLERLAYRVGTHATFLETMKARLSLLCLGDEEDCKAGEGARPLRHLTMRLGSDPAIAFLDAWATVADVLTFYQERLLNEGYLPTATERRSILELGRLVGYKLRPGVAASVYLAFELEEDYDIEIPTGVRAQSIPDGDEPEELPQSFETSEPLQARAEWNAIRPRQTRPQRITLSDGEPAESDVRLLETLYLQGTANNLDVNDPLLFVFGENPDQQVLRRVKSVEVEQEAARTKVSLQPLAFEQLLSSNLRALRHEIRELSNSGPEGVTANRIRDHLLELQEAFGEDETRAAEVLQEVTLPALEAELLDLADSSTALRSWLSTILSVLGARSGVIQPLVALSELSALARAAPPAAPPAALQLGFDGENGFGEYVEGSILSALAEYEWVDSLQRAPAVQPANGVSLARDAQQTFDLRGDMALKLLAATDAALGGDIYTVVANARLTEQSPLRVYALRVKAPLFGHNAPRAIDFGENGGIEDDEDFDPVEIHAPLPQDQWREWTTAGDERNNRLFLDRAYDEITSDGYVIVQRLEDADTDEYRILSFPIGSVSERSRNAYGLSGETTVITLGDDQSWWPTDETPPFTSIIRGTTVFAQSELLELAEAPVTAPVSGLRLELDGLYDGLESGRWIVVSGERNDISGASGVTAKELVMIAGIEQRYDPDLQGDSAHTALLLANEGLSYEYKRDTVTIYANVVKATHGETRQEVLGSGDGAQAFQRFDLKQGPLTYVAAPSPDGVATTLEVRVDGVRWHEAEMLFALEAGSRNYVTQADNEQKTAVIFGDGKRGARPPSGVENVRAVYRSGIGKPGNVDAGQISMLVTRPLGVKGVSNPLRASGGADAESRDTARRNTPLATMALDRLVSLQDYEDFARTFAGIGKASAAMLSDGRRRLVHLTVAGAEDIPIDKNSDLYRNLRLALQQSGDPFQPFQVQTRNLVALIISARVRLHPDYAWELVAPQIRSALLEAFGFEQRQLGQDAHLSAALRVIQGVGGVTYVDVDIFDGLSETEATDATLLAQKLLALSGVVGDEQPKQNVIAELARVDEDGNVQPAQLAFLNPQTPDTLILTEIH